MLSRNFFKRLPSSERNHIKDGAAVIGVITGAFGYMHYRKYLQKQFYLSEGEYRF